MKGYKLLCVVVVLSMVLGSGLSVGVPRIRAAPEGTVRSVESLYLPVRLESSAPLELGTTQAPALTRLYVDGDATGAATGLSWTDAYTNVQDALDYTNAHGSTDYEIWVAEGVYYPDEDSDGDHVDNSRTESFRLNYNNVQLYGGFAGTETTRDQRDWERYVTILSGDIDANDWNTDTNYIAETWNDIVGDNAYHVLYLDGATNEAITETTVIDGFTITAGKANDSSNPHNRGGGLYCDGYNSECSPSLAHVTFSGNQANDGGGMYNDGQSGDSSPALINAIFSGNQGSRWGAGMFNYGVYGDSSPALINVTFSGNQAVQGGGMFNHGVYGNSNPTLTNVLFSGNQADQRGGGMYNNGIEGFSNPTLTNVTFSGNQANGSGGGIYNSTYLYASNPVLTNVILWGNSAATGAQIYNSNASPILKYSLVQGGCPAGATCDGNLLTSDPLFVIPISATTAPTTIGDYRLQANSPAIDAGDNHASELDGVTTDLDGHARFKDMPTADTGNGVAPIVDMGAYEAPITLHVDADATGAATGLSWTDAYTNVQDALDYTNAHGNIDYEIWVAEGVYYPDEDSDGDHVNNSRTESFSINYNNVQLYGGFAGTETARDQRDWERNVTILSGDIDANDWNTDMNYIAETWNDIVGSNAYHVLYFDGVTYESITETTAIDGFVITAGQANGGSYPHGRGGGGFCDGEGSECSPALAHVTFSGNQADHGGGGIYSNGDSGASHPMLTYVNFSGNYARDGGGGGMYNDGENSGTSSPVLTNVTFSGNLASYGGGMYNYGGWKGYSGPMLTNVTFSGNQATGFFGGGGMSNDGRRGTCSPVLTNVTFSGNQASRGGGMSNDGQIGTSNPVLNNVILWGNIAETGPQIYNYVADPTINYSLAQDGCPAGATCDGNLLTSDPLFVAPITATAAPTTTGDYRLQAASPAIDAGDNNASGLSGITTDLDSNPRFMDMPTTDTGNGVPPIVDMGAYEVQSASEHPPQITSLSPPRNAVAAPLSTRVAATYDQPMDASRVTSQTFVVHGMQSGMVEATYSVIDGDTIVITPTRSFHQGELVYAVAKTGTRSLAGTYPLTPTQWQFNAGRVMSRCVGGFSDIEAGLSGVSDGSVAWGDYDQDGDLDILLTGSDIAEIYRNDDGNFISINAGLPGVIYSSVAWGDYDNDNDLDILLAGRQHDWHFIAEVYQNHNGIFTAVGAGLPGGEIGNDSSATWGDYDNDGDLDILLAFVNGLESSAEIYRNDAGTFVPINAGLSWGGYGTASWGDYDNDGDLDILLTGGQSEIYGNEKGVFNSISVGLPSVSGSSSAWGDYDNDGDLDILLTGYYNDGTAHWVTEVYQNDEGNFSAIEAGLHTAYDGTAAWGDYDNDGDLDILLAGYDRMYDPVVYLYQNDEGAFSEVKRPGLPWVDGPAAWGDYDNDGDLDILITGWDGNDVISRVYRNNDCGIDQQPAHLIATLAFDNNLAPYTTDVIERVRAGTANNPDTVATLLVDGDQDGDTQVLEIANGEILTHTQVPVSLSGELNTADPAVLADFLTWARGQHPDHREVVALVGHGAGLSPEVHAQLEQSGIRSVLPPLPRGHDFTPVDVTNGTYLSTPELGRALAAATDNGATPFDVVFFDQCFMGNLDTLYEVRETADVFVASPNYAWAAFAYDDYLAALTPQMTNPEIAQSIVDAYQAKLDSQHPNALFWVRGADLAPIADALSALGDALRTNGMGDAAAKTLNAALRSQFVDTTLCHRDFELCPPDEMVDLRSFATALQDEFTTGSEVHTAAGQVLTALDAVHTTGVSGRPWFEDGRLWSLETLGITALAPLTPTLSPGTVWRASLYTETASLTAVWSSQPTRTVAITQPWALTVGGRWDDFISAWYAQGGVITPTVGQLCYTFPPATPVTPTCPITLTAESGWNNIQLQWNATNAPGIIGYRIVRAVQGTATFEPVAETAHLQYFDDDPNMLYETTYCYQVEALLPGGVAVMASNIACAPYGQLELWVPDVRGKPDETAIIPINIRNADGLRLAATDIWLDFDGAVIEPLAVLSTALTVDYTWSYAITSTSAYSRVKIAAMAEGDPPSLHGDGSLFWLLVRVRGSATMTSPLNLREFVAGVGGSTIYTPEDPLHPVPMVLEDGTFRVAETCILGDLNNNGVVQAIDAWIALQMAVGKPVPGPCPEAGDVNGNGVVDAADATMILYYAAHGRWPRPGEDRLRRPTLATAAVHHPAQDLVVRLDDVHAAPGTLAQTTLRVDNLIDGAGGDFIIAYDPSLVQAMVDVAPAGLMNDFLLEFYDGGQGLLHIAIAADGAVSGSGALAEITMRLAADAAVGDSAPLALAGVRLHDAFGRDFATSALQREIRRENGAIRIEQAEAGVYLSPGDAQTAPPGMTVAFTHTVMNTGSTTDTIVLEATNTENWPWDLRDMTLYPGGTLRLPLRLSPRMTAAVVLSLTVPTAAVSGTVNTTAVTATSLGDPTTVVTATDVTRVIGPISPPPHTVFLPLVKRE